MKPFIGIALLSILTAAGPALANHGHEHTGIDQRQHELAQRLEYGWRSGELTRREYRRLHTLMREIDRTERFFRSDGHLSPHERGELHARLDRLSREIHREARDFDRHPEPYNYERYTDRRF